jgi:hypothetical protein
MCSPAGMNQWRYVLVRKSHWPRFGATVGYVMRLSLVSNALCVVNCWSDIRGAEPPASADGIVLPASWQFWESSAHR